MWLWSIHEFWRFTPWGWLVAIIWNLFEMFRVPQEGLLVDFAPWAFRVITGEKGKAVGSGVE